MTMDNVLESLDNLFRSMKTHGVRLLEVEGIRIETHPTYPPVPTYIPAPVSAPPVTTPAADPTPEDEENDLCACGHSLSADHMGGGCIAAPCPVELCRSTGRERPPIED